MENKKIGIFNNKGGVGKTTSVINLAYGIQKHDKKVLVVDCDTQENCFMFFTISNERDQLVFPTAYDNIYHTTWENYNKLSELEYDFILFDCPPALSDTVRAIINTCDCIYVPTILGEFEIAGLKNVTEEIQRQGTKLGGVFVTMYNADNDAELIGEFKSMLQERLCDAVIPYSKTIRESQKSGLAIEPYFKSRNVPNIGSAWKIVNAYNSLAEEIINKQ